MWGAQFALPLLALSAVVTVLCLCVRVLRAVRLILVVGCAVSMASAAVYAYDALYVRPLTDLDGETVAATVQITDVADGGYSYTVRVEQSDSLPKGTRLQVSFPAAQFSFQKYDKVRGEVAVYTTDASQKYLYGDGIFLKGKYTSVEAMTAGNARWYEQIGERVRYYLEKGIDQRLIGTEGAVLSAICLGDTKQLSADITTDFRRSGLAHVLVVSGLHMTLLVGAVAVLLKLLRLPKYVTLCGTLAVLWIFIFTVGFSASVMRAAVMLHFVLIGRALKQRADTRTSLAAALLLLLLQNPYTIYDVGCMLSFAATWGLVVFPPVFQSVYNRIQLLIKHPAWCRVIDALVCPIAAMIATMPILAYSFGSIAVLAPIANALTVYPLGFVLPATLLGGALHAIPFVGLLSDGLFFLSGLLIKWVIFVAQVVSAWSASQWQVRYAIWPILWIVITVVLYGAHTFCTRSGKRRVLVTSIVLVTLAVTMLTLFERQTTAIRIANASDSLVMVMQKAGRSAAIISGEDEYAYYMAQRYLENCGVDRLDALVITDADASTVASLAQLLDAVPAHTVIYPADAPDSVAGVAHIDKQPVENAAAFTLWNDTALYTANGWWRIDAGDTRMLIAPPKGRVVDLPHGWKNVHMTVLRNNVPYKVATLRTQEMVMICDDQAVRTVTEKLPWGSCPIHLTAVDGERAVCTVGKGDIASADRLWI